MQTIEVDRLNAQRILEAEKNMYEEKIAEIRAANSKEITALRAEATRDSEAMSMQIKDLHTSLENANALFVSRMGEVSADSDKEGAAVVAISAQLLDSQKNFSELNFYKETLEKRLRDAEATIEQKESVIKIMQDQLVMMANESMQGLDDALKSKQVDIRPDTGPWQQLEDEGGNKYYYNKETSESTWDPPPGYAVSVDGKLRPRLA
jgi:DNA repair exonuclease SbcCD ATPase subunit